jgi:hypothetical protein
MISLPMGRKQNSLLMARCFVYVAGKAHTDRANYDVGDLGLCRRHEGEWVGIMNVH